MRAALFATAILIAGACKGGDSPTLRAKSTEVGSANSGSGSSAQVPFDVPRMTGLLPDADAKLPPAGPILWIDPIGKIEVGATGPTWMTAKRVAVPEVRRDVYRRVLEAAVIGGGAVGDTAKAILAVLDAPPPADDDPPPPEEEDKPDDGAEESGGTGTAMALDEGKMGKKDRDRAEGQYKMKKTDDPQLARQQAIEQARAAGILGSSALAADADPAWPTTNDNRGARGIKRRQLSPMTPLILASAKAPAVSVVQVVMQTGGMLGVMNAGKLAILPMGFAPPAIDEFSVATAYGRSSGSTNGYAMGGGRRKPRVAVEVHLDHVGVHLVVSPTAEVHDVPWKADAVDRVGLRAAWDKAKLATKASALPVDVLVRGDTTAQQLADVVFSLEAIGVDVYGKDVLVVDETSSTVIERVARLQLERERERERGNVPTVTIGAPATTGDLDKAIIRRYIRRNQPKFAYCYEKRLLVKPTLEGTVAVSFLIHGNGVVTQATASGVDPEVATCVAGVVKAIEFPKPKNGGNVQVNYPFTFRRAGG